ncbi:3'-5' exoribonuclease [Variovorax saccharolyticus]|uniref:3'-5' exoribonuclease n=1 Tax=Variovorax saccharolyticus TaxID=3053516 RepID=UPI002574FF4B|nr:3'-5' exoribonuclease [Variovorax sp. J22R187]MDM0018031.1 3'-5' exoribonuclease [Variovorax sp. J22R187]
MRIFFDTEFTALRDDAELISIGLVDETARHTFYAEVLGVDASRCSPFCRASVLPILEGGSAALPLGKLRETLRIWLFTVGPATLVCDSSRDMVQLLRLFPDGLPGGCSVSVLGFVGNMRRRLLNLRRRLHRRHGLRVHHALDDAKVNRIALV